MSKKAEKQMLQDWIPSGSIETRFFNYENMISFAKHFANQQNKDLRKKELIDFADFTIKNIEIVRSGIKTKEQFVKYFLKQNKLNH